MSNQIASLNDRFRSSFGYCDIPGIVVITAGIYSLPPEAKNIIFNKVLEFSVFTEDADPYGEHDFGAFDHAGQRIYWKLTTTPPPI